MHFGSFQPGVDFNNRKNQVRDVVFTETSFVASHSNWWPNWRARDGDNLLHQPFWATEFSVKAKDLPVLRSNCLENLVDVMGRKPLSVAGRVSAFVELVFLEVNIPLVNSGDYRLAMLALLFGLTNFFHLYQPRLLVFCGDASNLHRICVSRIIYVDTQSGAREANTSQYSVHRSHEADMTHFSRQLQVQVCMMCVCVYNNGGGCSTVRDRACVGGANLDLI